MIFKEYEHLEILEYSIQIGDESVEKVVIYNRNKLAYDTVVACIETDTFNRFMLTMSKDMFVSLFLDEHSELLGDSEDVTD